MAEYFPVKIQAIGNLSIGKNVRAENEVLNLRGRKFAKCHHPYLETGRNKMGESYWRIS